jgi:hypothetical protein
MNALIILTKTPNPEIVDFYKTISRDNYDVYLLSDDNSSNLIIDDDINYLQIDDELCKKYGYHSFNPVINKNKFGSLCISAWDKALFYFGRLNKSYDNIWFIEDDVFVPDINLFQTMDDQFFDEDLLASGNNINTTGEIESWFWWKTVPMSNLPLPWAQSAVCAVRMSKKLIRIVDNYVTNNMNSLKFIEYIFHTLALHNNLNVKTVNNLKGIVWRREWKIEELENSIIYHPVKNFHLQTQFRAYLSNF